MGHQPERTLTAAGQLQRPAAGSSCGSGPLRRRHSSLHPPQPHRWVQRHVKICQLKRPGFICSLSAEACMPLPASVLFELLVHPNTDEVMTSLGRCVRRHQAPNDEQGRRVAEVEQETTVQVMWFSGRVRTPLQVVQDGASRTMQFRLSPFWEQQDQGGEAGSGSNSGGGCGHLAALEGHWTVTEAGPHACLLRLEQSVHPRGVPPLLGGAVRSFVSGQIRGNFQDLYSEALRIRAGKPTLQLSSLATASQCLSPAGADGSTPVSSLLNKIPQAAAAADGPDSHPEVERLQARTSTQHSAAHATACSTPSSSLGCSGGGGLDRQAGKCTAGISPLNAHEPHQAGPRSVAVRANPTSVLEPQPGSSSPGSTRTSSAASTGGSASPSGEEISSPFAAWSSHGFDRRPPTAQVAASAACWPVSHALPAARLLNGAGSSRLLDEPASRGGIGGSTGSGTACTARQAQQSVGQVMDIGSGAGLLLASGRLSGGDGAAPWLLHVMAAVWLLALALPLLVGAQSQAEAWSV